MKKINNEKAITLIALVITVIVLTIISAIVISTVAGDNGIISFLRVEKFQPSFNLNFKQFVDYLATKLK